MTRSLRRHEAERAKARARRLLVERFGWNWPEGPSVRDVSRYSCRSPKPCGDDCPWCEGNRTVSTRRRAASVQPETEP